MAVGLDEPDFWSSGVEGHWIPVALMWFVYKLVFIGIHPVDRLALQIPGNPPPGPDYPEPFMKLLTEPYFQYCTGPMMVLVKILFY